MTLFLDTANLVEVESYLKWGCFKGVTTNQEIFKKSGEKYSKDNYHRHIRRICELCEGLPVSVELTGSVLGAVDEAKTLSHLADNVVIKVPMWNNGSGLKIIHELDKQKIKTNATVLMKSSQAIMAAEAGADYVSLFYRRICDAHSLEYAKKAFTDTRKYLDDQGLKGRIIAGSIRQTNDILSVFKAGAHIVTVKPALLESLVNDPSTEKTIAEFDNAWKEYTRG